MDSRRAPATSLTSRGSTQGIGASTSKSRCSLDQLRSRFPNTRAVYPGHGAPGEPAALIEQQRVYLDRYRQFVEPATTATSPAADTVTPHEQAAIMTELDRDYPGYQRVASLPTLQQENIKAVARELVSGHRC